MTTIGDTIARVRTIIKGVKEDAFLTDRNIYHVVLKYAQTLIKREDNQNKLMRMSTLFTTLPIVELIDVDKIEAECYGISSGCKIKRTKDKIPDLLTGVFGPLFRTVSSIDTSTVLFRTEPGVYSNMIKSTTFKYNTKKYYWYLNGYLYIPDIEWETLKIEAIFEGDISEYLCDEKEQCIPKHERFFNISEYLFSEIEQFVIKEFTTTLNIPSNGADDTQNALR
jgi:hypothetical protein